MTLETQRYELPESTDKSIRNMALGLTLLLISFCVVTGLVIYYSPALAKMVPFGAEQRFVRPYEKMIGKLFSDSIGDPTVRTYLQDLADDLHVAMEVSPEIELTVHFIDNDQLNAMATLGGHIIVFSGLLEAMPDENSLAMVLAHEVAHVQHRDPVAAMGRGMALQMLFGFFTGGGGTGQDALSITSNLSEGIYSRNQEKQADLAALSGIHQHYGHVAGYSTFFEKIRTEEILSEDDTDRFELSRWLSSHPETEDRITYLTERAKAIGASTGQPTPLPMTF